MKIFSVGLGGSRARTSSGIAFVLLFCSWMACNAQIFEWARMGGGPGWKRGNTIAVDANGNSYAGGEFSGPNGIGAIAFKNQPDSSDFITSRGITDGFIVKYDDAGIIWWMLQLRQLAAGQQTASVTVRSIALTADNTLYVTGECEGEIDFGNLSKTALKGSSFIAKYERVDLASTTTPPTATWVRVIGPASENAGTAVCNGIAVRGSNASEDIYVCGQYSRAITFEGTDASHAKYRDNPTTISSLFLARYDAGGNPKWNAADSDVAHSSTATAVTILSSGDPVITGYAAGPISLDAIHPVGVGGDTQTNVLIVRFSATFGAPLWMRAADLGQFPGQYDSAIGSAIATDGTNIYVTGRKIGPIGFPCQYPGPTISSPSSDFFLAKYDATGISKWAVSGGAATVDGMGNGLAVKGNYVYVTGGFAGRMDLESAPSSTYQMISVGSLGGHDIFVAKYDTNGGIQWAQRAGNAYTDGTPGQNYCKGNAIGIDNRDFPFIVGEFGFEANFFGTTPLKYPHFRNVFVAKILKSAQAISGTVTVDSLPSINHPITVTNTSWPDAALHVLTGPTGNYTAYQREYGDYRIESEPVPYRFLKVPDPYGYYQAQPRKLEPLVSQDFVFVKNTDSADLRITITKLSPGYATASSTVPYLIEYRNLGTQPVSNANITFNTNPAYVNSITWNTLPNGLTPNSGSASYNISWNIPYLNPLDDGQFVVWVTLREDIAQEVQVGVSATIRRQGGVLLPDANPIDNNAAIVEVVWLPSDPNGKFVTPAGNIGVAGVRAGMDLTYTIEFFNIGAAVARAVNVYDTLDAGVFVLQDSILPRYWSPMKPDVIVRGSDRNQLQFHFYPANLQSVYNSVTRSHGFVTFNVPLKRNLRIGTYIRNSAGIKFDNQEFIHTDTAVNCIYSDFALAGSCEGDTTTFVTQSDTEGSYLWDGPDSVLNIRWDFGDKTTATGRFPRHAYSAPGTYPVTVRFEFAHKVRICEVFDSIHIIHKSIVIAARTAPTITRSQDTMGVPGQGDTLISSEGPAYQWYWNGHAIDGAREQRYVMRLGPGTYTVRITNHEGCLSYPAADSITVDTTTTGVPGGTDIGEPSLHPTPGPGPFRLALGRNATREWKLSVVDLAGRTLLLRELPAGRSACEFDLPGEPSGVYVARIEIGGVVFVRRFVMVR